jgi:Tol biopolymer transport system component
VAKRMTPVLLAGALLLLLAAVGPAEAAFPGTNGKIAYESAGRSDAEIRSTNLDGTGGINLTRNNGIDDRHAAWSADGEKVAYVSGGDEGFGSDSLSDLYVMNADGSGKTRLTESADFGEAEPTWSPDGARIAFTRVEYRRDDVGDYFYYYETYDVYAINADGTGEVRLTDDAKGVYGPAWSPDGTRIAFTSSRGTTPRTAGAEIYVMEPSPEGPSNEPVRLTATRSANTSPNWSPDGTKIAFESGRDRPRSHDFTPEVYTMNADGTEPTRLTRKGWYRDPVWTPDGKRLAFTRDGIYTMKAAPLGDGNRPRLVVPSEYSYENPDWQPIP